MTAVVLLTGLGTGVGLWLLIAGFFPPPQRLDDALAALHRRPPPPTSGEDATGWVAKPGRSMVVMLTRLGLPTAGTRRHLVALGKPAQVHLAEQAIAALLGLLAAPTVAVLLALAGVDLGLTLPLWAALVLAAGGALLPELAVRSEAVKQRAAWRHALGAYLDLVVVSLAGGSGVDQALDDAASIGRGPAFGELRHALAEARLARVPPWDTLAALGTRVGVDELGHLAGTVGLAGAEGAKVRASLRARAVALRTRQLTDAEADASAATERMSLPVVLLFGGFLLFLGFPAVAAVLGGL